MDAERVQNLSTVAQFLEKKKYAELSKSWEDLTQLYFTRYL